MAKKTESAENSPDPISAEVFEIHRPKLFGIAYRMLGTVTEAEDAVQDTYLRWRLALQRNSIQLEETSKANVQAAIPERVDNPEAYLVTIITRLCIDNLKSARAKRESYIGPWLPEPLITEPVAGPEIQQELAETLSFAFMMLLEQLSPAERAVYILREAFNFKHQEIADILGRSTADSRQLNKRARTQLQQPGRRYAATDADQEQLFNKFLAAAAGEDMQPLFDFLAEDIVAHTDGGGKVRAALKVLVGKPRVIEFVRRVLPGQESTSELSLCKVNGKPAIKQTLDGNLTAIVTVQFVNAKVQQLFIVRNPEKLSRATLGQPVL